jgi:hypothetical protein
VAAAAAATPPAHARVRFLKRKGVSYEPEESHGHR